MEADLDRLNIWASVLNTNSPSATPQRLTIPEEVSKDGYLQGEGNRQQWDNQLLFQLSRNAAPEATPFMYYGTIGDALTEGFYSFDGSAFLQEDAPLLFLKYSGVMPDLNTDIPLPSGWVWVARIA